MNNFNVNRKLAHILVEICNRLGYRVELIEDLIVSFNDKPVDGNFSIIGKSIAQKRAKVEVVNRALIEFLKSNNVDIQPYIEEYGKG